MADPVLKPLVNSGLGPNLRQLQRTGDGQSDMGAGARSARLMTGGGAVDGQTAGGLRPDSPGKYAHLPEPIRGLIGRNLAGDPDPEGGRD